MQRNIKKAIIKFLNGEKPGKLLDIPAGTGWLEKELKGKGWHYYPADLFTRLDHKHFKVADLNNALPYENDTMDYIACIEGVEHIENYHFLLREFQRVLKTEGKVIISTPNPLNYKSRKKYKWSGTFNGFPHLIKMPKEGDHMHISPINLSFLITFAEKYGLSLDRIHPLEIKAKNYRNLLACLALKAHTTLRYLFKDKNTKAFMKQLVSLNVLLNDGIVVSFTKT